MNEGLKTNAPIFEPRTGEEKTRNQGIANRIKVLLDKPEIKSSLIVIDPELHGTPDFAFGLYAIKRRRTNLPKDISYPLFALSLDSARRRFRNDDGKIYRLELAFFLNEKGQGFKRLNVMKDSSRMSPKSIADNFGLISYPYDKTNTPKHVALSDRDCSKIAKMIKNAEDNKLSEPSLMPKSGAVIVFKNPASTKPFTI